MSKDKNNKVTYTLEITYNPDTDEVEYIAEGFDDEVDFTPITPNYIDKDYTKFITSEDMEMIKDVYDIEEN
jgi:hypothetical protein